MRPKKRRASNAEFPVQEDGCDVYEPDLGLATYQVGLFSQAVQLISVERVIPEAP